MSKTASRWMTREAYERLKEELRVLNSDPDDDPGTNSGTVGGAGNTIPAPRYIHDPGVREARVKTIERLLLEAVVEDVPDDGIAAPGKVLTIRFDDEEETEEFLLGVRDASVSEGMDVYSPESPLGASLLGARPGERRTFTSPRGAVIGVTLVAAEPYRSPAAN
ncbi:GreA/GreB family elongation factor [Nocardiopsis algeriensis]|uniref:Transcription elongation factor GreA n=1 Tax=Nocardiopsis algeriensis TaxID=1478215 RepID=A0A841IPP8_9ACTN|nr:GreA/GreB family elongation factor [Nocardiopsis algeriensis]MBB6120819.1 transcription elongation factor GreA [Nocardiopsis algeriensis]